MADTAGLEAKEEHYDTANDGDDTNPVDCLNTSPEGSLRRVDFQEQYQDD